MSFAEVLTAAIQNRGLSLERIRARLEAADVPVSIAMLSYWQSGRSPPTRARSYHTLVELEGILNLEPGHLTSLTHTPDGRTRRELFAWQTVLPARELAAAIIDDLGIDMQGQLTRVTMADHVTIGADRSEQTLQSLTTWRAERHGLHRWAVVLEQDADTSHDPVIEPMFGCRLGEVVEVPEHRLVVAEMRALRPLQRGDLFTSAYRIDYAPSALPSFRMQRSCAETVRVLSLMVTFDRAALPARVQARTLDAIDDEEPTTSFDVPLTLTEAQVVRVDARPGVYSLYWDWE